MIEIHRTLTSLLLWIAISVAASPAFAAARQESKSPQNSKTANAKVDDAEDSEEAKPKVPSWRGEFRSVKLETKPEAAERAWETRPYQVAVWVCFDGSPAIAKLETEICERIALQCQLHDPSGWVVNVGTPPSQWRWGLKRSNLTPETIAAIVGEPELEFYDKLIVIRVDSQDGQFKVSAREIDVKTQQQGALVASATRVPQSIASLATDLITRAFMPIARIDNINPKNEAFLRARGIEACIRTRINEDLEPEVVTIRSSPCFVRESDKFLPVEVRTDRKGNIEKLEAVPFSFIAIEKLEGNSIVGKLHSSRRAILTSKKSKRAEKLGLVIRPPQGETVLRLMSRGTEEPQPLEGYEIHSRRPEDPPEVLNFVGKTDWRGEITIPSGDGLYLLLVRRGGKNLKKVPVIPGFRDHLETTVTSDDSRLMARGVVTGLQNEILSLVVLRELYEKDINKALDDGRIDEARNILRQYTDLEDPQELKIRLADEQVRLKSRTTVERERKAIKELFDNLLKIVNSDFVRSKEAEFRERIENGGKPLEKPDVKKAPTEDVSAEPAEEAEEAAAE
jgi:hypothetical protein